MVPPLVHIITKITRISRKNFRRGDIVIENKGKEGNGDGRQGRTTERSEA